MRGASALVKAFAAEHGLAYAEFGFVAGNREVLGTLRAVAEQVQLMGAVAHAEVVEAVEKRNADAVVKKVVVATANGSADEKAALVGGVLCASTGAKNGK